MMYIVDRAWYRRDRPRPRAASRPQYARIVIIIYRRDYVGDQIARVLFINDENDEGGGPSEEGCAGDLVGACI